MIIRNEQVRQLGEAKFDRFVVRMRVHLRGKFPFQTGTFDEDELSALIRESVTQANRFGIKSEWALRKFLDYRVLFGPAFYNQPKFRGSRRTLYDSGIAETEKMNRLCEHAVFG